MNSDVTTNLIFILDGVTWDHGFRAKKVALKTNFIYYIALKILQNQYKISLQLNNSNTIYNIYERSLSKNITLPLLLKPILT